MKSEIQANELRIGNKIIVHDTIDTISEISYNSIICANTGYSNLDKGYVEPIPLTEEILLKCGFKTLDKYTFVFKGFFIHKRKRGFIYGKNKIIKFTHQLQNIYFALTCQELEINL